MRELYDTQAEYEDDMDAYDFDAGLFERENERHDLARLAGSDGPVEETDG